MNASKAGIIVLGALLAGCGGGGDSRAGGAGAAAGTGGTAVVAVRTDFDAFNPVTASALTTDEINKYMLFTPLIQYDAKLNPVPYLAERWELSDTAVVFYLRNGVTWQDGKPVTAEDVKFTFDLAKNPASASALSSAYLGMVKSATVVDPRTIRFGFVAPHAQPLDGFWWAPLPKHLLQNVPPAQLMQAPFNRQPVGSGPFKLREWKAGQQAVFEANPSFPAAMGGPPKLARVVFRIIPEATTRTSELLTRNVDINYSVQPEEANQVKSQQGFRLYSFPSREFTFFGWNNEREPFRDARVRRALAMALNRPEMVRSLMRGHATLSPSVIPPISPMSPNLQPLPYDPAAAKQLLAQAGWRDANGDGILEKGGKPLRFTIITNSSNKNFTDIATRAQAQLKQIGVDAQVQPVEFQTMLRQHKAREYDAILTNWTWDYFKVDPTPLFSCAEARKKMSANRAGYCNPRVDSLIQAGLKETNPAQARPIWAEFSRVLQEDQPLTVLFWAAQIGAAGPQLQGVEMDARSKLVSVTQWTKTQ